MNATPLLSALVLNYRSPKDTVRCVQALLAQTIADRMEIIVVDNHSCDESISFIRAQLGHEPLVRIVETRENLGYGRGNNVAAGSARGEYLLIINPDNTVPKDAAEQMLKHLQAHPNVGIVGPALVYSNGSVRPSARALPTLRDLLRKRLFPSLWHDAFEQERQRFAERESVEVDWIVGACLVLQTTDFKRLGGFDERFFLFFEDIDLCRRIRQIAKSVVYLPRIRVGDRKERLSGGSIFSMLSRKTTRIHLWSAVKYFWKWWRVSPFAS